MGLIHWLTKVRYEIMIQAKLPVSDSIFENIIELYYKIPYYCDSCQSLFFIFTIFY